MKNNLLISIVVLVLVGVGVYFAMNRQAPQTGGSDEGVIMKDEGSEDKAMMEDKDTMMEAKEIVVEGSGFKFVPNTITVKKGEKTRIVFKNVGGMHDFVIDELGIRTKVINTGEEDSVEFTAEEAGVYEFYCSVMNHRELGMVGTLTVEE